jgi:hypothetical protein
MSGAAGLLDQSASLMFYNDVYHQFSATAHFISSCVSSSYCLLETQHLLITCICLPGANSYIGEAL